MDLRFLCPEGWEMSRGFSFSCLSVVPELSYSERRGLYAFALDLSGQPFFHKVKPATSGHLFQTRYFLSDFS